MRELEQGARAQAIRVGDPVQPLEHGHGGAEARRNAPQAVPAAQMQEKIEAALGNLEPVGNGKLDGEARIYRLPGARGELGFISSVTQPFCAECTRARLTADGRLRLCLLREGEVDLLTALRSGASNAELRQIILDGIWLKPWGHGLAEGQIPLNRAMSEIGG